MLKQIINQDEESESGAPEDSESKGAGTPDISAKIRPSASMSSSKNILSSDVQIRGKLRFSNDLVIDGRIEGEVNSEGDLTVGENARILGDINTRSAVVLGKVDGNITVTDRCELKQNAELSGDIVASKLAIEEGAVFLGSSTVGSPSSIAKSPSPEPEPEPEPAPADSPSDDESEGGD